MKIIVYENEQQLADAAAAVFAAEVVMRKHPVLGLNAGGSTIAIYQKLIDMNKAGSLDFSEVKTFDIDEMVNLSSDDPHSFAGFVGQYFFNHVNLKKENMIEFDNFASDLEAECVRFEQEIANAGGIDVILVGIGPNGHVAINEPAPSQKVDTYLHTLSGSRLEATKKDFAENPDIMPTQGLTMGMGTILRCKKLVIVATGKNKAEAVKHMVNGEIDTMWPVSLLQLHSNAVLLLDKEAASLL